MEIKSAMILAGGLGTRFKEYTEEIPKPMIKANNKPLLLHVSNIFSNYDVNNIYILGGYKINSIIEYFDENFKPLSQDENVYCDEAGIKYYILDTGVETMTGGRIKQGFEVSGDSSSFVTYGDGVANVDIKSLYNFYKNKSSIATLTAVRPPARFGSLNLEGSNVKQFNEKNQSDEGWINGGFFALSKEICEYIPSDSVPFEKEPLERLSSEGLLSAYKHAGLFRPVDTIRELELLEEELDNNAFGFIK